MQQKEKETCLHAAEVCEALQYVYSEVMRMRSCTNDV